MQKVLVLGAGLVSRPLVHYLLDHKYEVIVASRTVAKAEALVKGYKNGRAEQLKIEEDGHLDGLIEKCDLAISLVPYTYHVSVAKHCLRHKKDMVTTSYVSKDMKALDADAKESGVILLNEIGVDPGIDHMSAMRIIHSVFGRGGKVESFYSYCGGLPAPDANTNPWGYKFSWSPRGVVLATKNNGKYLKDGKVVEVPSKDLFTHYWRLKVEGAGEFEAYVNRDSLPYIDIYGLHGIGSMYRGTLRNLGWCDTWKKIVDLGFQDDEKKYDLKGKTYGDFMKMLSGVSGGSAKDAVAKKLGIKADSTPIKWFEWLGLLGDEKVPKLERPTAMGLFVELLQRKLVYKPGERDMLVMYHKFIAAFGGRKEKITSTMVDFGIPNGDTSMSRTVSLPCAIGARLILEGKINLKGVHIPVVPEIYNPVLDELEKMDIICREEIC